MIRCLLFIIITAYSVQLCAQDTLPAVTKKVMESSFSIKKADTKALIIGISDYQNIRSLNYAHRDAEEFAEFLRYNKGWKLKEENILKLTNDQANQGDILMGLQWLLDVSNAGEEIIFYFSGHGDVETVQEQKKGFLLAHDSPKNNYPLGGTIAVQLLDSVFSELIKREVKVTMIIDACRSGNLAGGMIGKSQTSEALAKRWKNEIRILSAQPEQFSYEDKKWGDGRSVFSYFLTKGLSGHADSNGDLKIYLSELEQYIGNNISNQTNYTQQPVVEGSNKFSLVISMTDEVQMARYSNDNIEGEINLTLANSKAGDEVLDPACSEYANHLLLLLDKGLKIDSFLEVEKNWKSLNNCSGQDVPSQIRYKYMRSLINEINRIVQITLTGEKLSIETELNYALVLIDELFEINTGRKFVGEDHFHLLNDYLKSILYSFYNDKFLSYNIYEYSITLNEEWDYYDVENFQELLYEYGYFDAKVQKVDTSRFPITSLTIKTSLDFANDIVDIIRYTYSGELQLHSIIYGDSLLISKTIQPKNKIQKNIGVWNYEKKYSLLLLNKLNEDLQGEPDAAYLYYAKALLLHEIKQYDSSIFFLNQAVEKSPKWLMPRYLIGASMVSNQKFTAAISQYEEILELDSIYLDFECTDCFYMGLLNLYLKTDQTEKIDPVIEKWIKNRSDKQTRQEAYKELFQYSDGNKKTEKFWFEKMKESNDESFQHQLDLIIMARKLHPKKYKNKEIIHFIQAMVKLDADKNMESFLSDPLKKRYEIIPNKVIRDFFPDGLVIVGYEQNLLHENMLNILNSIESDQLFISKKIAKESFLLAGIIRLENSENYAYWVECLDKQVEQSGYYNWIHQAERIDSEEMEEFFIELFDLNAEQYKTSYAKLYDEQFYELIYTLSQGGDFVHTDEYKKLRELCKTFEDFENLKYIEQTMRKFILDY